MKTPLTGNVASRPPESNQEWQAWGEKDPLFGVIPQPGRERDGATPWTDADFYQTGSGDWEEFIRRWRLYGVDRTSCVEIGCGAGRLTQHIARDFGEVHALDVAEGMINYARQHVGSNVHLYVTDGISLPVPRRQRDRGVLGNCFPALRPDRGRCRLLPGDGSRIETGRHHHDPDAVAPVARESEAAWYAAGLPAPTTPTWRCAGPRAGITASACRVSSGARSCRASPTTPPGCATL